MSREARREAPPVASTARSVLPVREHGAQQAVADRDVPSATGAPVYLVQAWMQELPEHFPLVSRALLHSSSVLQLISIGTNPDCAQSAVSALTRGSIVAEMRSEMSVVQTMLVGHLMVGKCGAHLRRR